MKFALKPIQPYIELAMLVDEVKKSAIRLVFRIDTNVKAKNIEAYCSATADATNDDYHHYNYDNTMRINIATLDTAFKLSITKIWISYLNKPIDLGIELAKKEFKINDLNFRQSPRASS